MIYLQQAVSGAAAGAEDRFWSNGRPAEIFRNRLQME